MMIQKKSTEELLSEYAGIFSCIAENKAFIKEIAENLDIKSFLDKQKNKDSKKSKEISALQGKISNAINEIEKISSSEVETYIAIKNSSDELNKKTSININFSEVEEIFDKTTEFYNNIKGIAKQADIISKNVKTAKNSSVILKRAIYKYEKNSKTESAKNNDSEINKVTTSEENKTKDTNEIFAETDKIVSELKKAMLSDGNHFAYSEDISEANEITNEFNNVICSESINYPGSKRTEAEQIASQFKEAVFFENIIVTEEMNKKVDIIAEEFRNIILSDNNKNFKDVLNKANIMVKNFKKDIVSDKTERANKIVGEANKKVNKYKREITKKGITDPNIVLQAAKEEVCNFKNAEISINSKFYKNIFKEASETMNWFKETVTSKNIKNSAKIFAKAYKIAIGLKESIENIEGKKIEYEEKEKEKEKEKNILLKAYTINPAEFGNNKEVYFCSSCSDESVFNSGDYKNKLKFECQKCKNLYTIDETYITIDKETYCNKCVDNDEYALDMSEITLEQIIKYMDGKFELRKRNETNSTTDTESKYTNETEKNNKEIIVQKMEEEWREIESWNEFIEIYQEVSKTISKDVLFDIITKKGTVKYNIKIGSRENTLITYLVEFNNDETAANRKFLNKIFSGFYIDKIVPTKNFKLSKKYNLNIREKDMFFRMYNAYHNKPDSVIKKILNVNNTTTTLESEDGQETITHFGYFRQLFDEYYYFDDFEKCQEMYSFLGQAILCFKNWYMRINPRKYNQSNKSMIDCYIFIVCLLFATNFMYIEELYTNGELKLSEAFLQLEIQPNAQPNTQQEHSEIISQNKDDINFTKAKVLAKLANKYGSISEKRRSLSNTMKTYRMENFSIFVENLNENARILSKFDSDFFEQEKGLMNNSQPCDSETAKELILNNRDIFEGYKENEAIGLIRYCVKLDLYKLIVEKITDIALSLKYHNEIWADNIALMGDGEYLDDEVVMKIVWAILLKNIKEENASLYKYLIHEGLDIKFINNTNKENFELLISDNADELLFFEVNKPIYRYLLRVANSKTSQDKEDDEIIIDIYSLFDICCFLGEIYKDKL